MADKHITELQLRSLVDGTVMFPIDDGIQTYRVTASQIFDYIRKNFYTARTISAGSVALTAADKVVFLDPSSASFTQALPACADVAIGLVIYFKNIATNGNKVTLDANSSELIDADETLILKSSLFQDSCALINTGTKWQNLTVGGQKKDPTISIARIGSHSGGFSADSAGTYALPTGCRAVKITMWGGGEGGAAGGSGGQAGTAGGDTTLSASLTAAGGPQGTGYKSGTPGSNTISIGSILRNLKGGFGQTSQNGTNLMGGIGGNNANGGAGSGGGGGTDPAGRAAAPDSGAGGGGGGAVGAWGGSGGCAGGFFEVWISGSDLATIDGASFTVGAAGVGSTAGTNNGGDAGAGGINMEEFY